MATCAIMSVRSKRGPMRALRTAFAFVCNGTVILAVIVWALSGSIVERIAQVVTRRTTAVADDE